MIIKAALHSQRDQIKRYGEMTLKWG